MKKIITSLFVISLISCSGSTSIGDPEIGGIYDEEDYKLVYQYNAFKLDGPIIRWPTRWISLYNIPLDHKALDIWKELGFVFIQGGSEIVYDGESQEDAPYCGRANWRWKSDTKGNYWFKSCNIVLNARKHTGYQCGSVENTLRHEIGHCLGILGHTSDGTLMDPTSNNSDELPNYIKRMLEVLYNTRTDVRIEEDGSKSYKINKNEEYSGNNYIND